MRYSTQIKPISAFKANAAEILTQIAETRNPVIITQNGEAKAVVQDVVSYEEGRETLALLKLLALGVADVKAGRTTTLAEVKAHFEAKRSSAA